MSIYNAKRTFFLLSQITAPIHQEDFETCVRSCPKDTVRLL